MKIENQNADIKLSQSKTQNNLVSCIYCLSCGSQNIDNNNSNNNNWTSLLLCYKFQVTRSKRDCEDRKSKC